MTPAKTDNLMERWREMEAAHSQVREALERALQRRHRISLSEYEVLRRLSEHTEGPCRMQDLSAEGELSQSALSRLVGRLEADGYVSRGVCDHDRRGVWAELTEEGRKAQAAAQPTYLSVLGENFAA